MTRFEKLLVTNWNRPSHPGSQDSSGCAFLTPETVPKADPYASFDPNEAKAGHWNDGSCALEKDCVRRRR